MAVTHAALEAIEEIVQSAAFGVTNIVSVNVSAANINDFGGMNEVYSGIMAHPELAPATVQVSGLVGARTSKSPEAVAAQSMSAVQFPVAGQ